MLVGRQITTTDAWIMKNSRWWRRKKRKRKMRRKRKKRRRSKRTKRSGNRRIVIVRGTGRGRLEGEVRGKL